MVRYVLGGLALGVVVGVIVALGGIAANEVWGSDHKIHRAAPGSPVRGTVTPLAGGLVRTPVAAAATPRLTGTAPPQGTNAPSPSPTAAPSLAPQPATPPEWRWRVLSQGEAFGGLLVAVEIQNAGRSRQRLSLSGIQLVNGQGIAVRPDLQLSVEEAQRRNLRSVGQETDVEPGGLVQTVLIFTGPPPDDGKLELQGLGEPLPLR